MGWSPLLSNRWPYRRHKSDKKEENYLIHLTMLFPSHWTFSPLATSHDSAWSTCINTILIVLDIFSTDPGFQQLLIDSHRSRRLISNSNYFFNDFFFIVVESLWKIVGFLLRILVDCVSLLIIAKYLKSWVRVCCVTTPIIWCHHEIYFYGKIRLKINTS